MTAAPRSPAERLAATLHQSCLDSSPDRGVEFFATALPALRAVNTPEDLARQVALLQRRSAPSFFIAFPSVDTHDQGRHGAIELAPGGFDQGTDYTDAGQRGARVETIASLLDQRRAFSEDERARIAGAAVMVESALAEAAKGFGGFQGGIDDTDRVTRDDLAALTPTFDWAAFFAALVDVDIAKVDLLDRAYFGRLDGVLRSLKLEDVRSYLIAAWSNAIAAVQTTGSCPLDVALAMSDAIAPRFLEMYGLDGEARAKVDDIFRSIVQTFGQELEKAPFLDPPTLSEARAKLAKMEGVFAVSPTLDDFSDVTLRSEDAFEKNIMTLSERALVRDLRDVGKALDVRHITSHVISLSAVYDPSRNLFQVAAGFMGGDEFGKGVEPLANYAGIGTTIGHEMTHGFDSEGRRFDGDGLRRDWWSATALAGFERRAQCMSDQYDAYDMPGVPDPVTGSMPAHVDGKRTLPENIADTGGLKLAYLASKVDGATLPVVGGFTPPQRFFINYAQLWCEKDSPAFMTDYLNTNPHAPASARAVVPLRNFDGFARAFACAPGSKMAPTNRCEVW
jgi:predicted metalloendopeptidase